MHQLDLLRQQDVSSSQIIFHYKAFLKQACGDGRFSIATAVLEAAIASHMQLVGANSVDINSAIYAAALWGHLPIVRYLFKTAFQNGINIHQLDSVGSGIEFSALIPNLDVVNLLLDTAVDMHMDFEILRSKISRGRVLAAQHDNPEILDLLRSRASSMTAAKSPES